jgi:hypothetical protein
VADPDGDSANGKIAGRELTNKKRSAVGQTFRADRRRRQMM